MAGWDKEIFRPGLSLPMLREDLHPPCEQWAGSGILGLTIWTIAVAQRAASNLWSC